MEIFGIILSAPVAFLASALYCILIDRMMRRFTQAIRALRAGSLAVLAAFVIELTLLITLGAVRSRERFGSAFYAMHLTVFFLGPPALANLLVLRNRRGMFGRWYTAAPLCTVFAFVLVLLQYGVSEALFGIDGSQ